MDNAITHGRLVRVNAKGEKGVWKCSLCKECGDFKYFQETICDYVNHRPSNEKLIMDALEEKE